MLGVAGVLYVFRILRNTKALGVGLFVSFWTIKQRQSSVCGQLDSQVGAVVRCRGRKGAVH